MREALKAANANGPGEDIVEFAVPGPLPVTIVPDEPLPFIVTAVTIDGASQPGYEGTPVVELTGSSSPPWASGLNFVNAIGCSEDCGDHRVRALVINRWGIAGIRDSSNRSALVVEGSYIGTDVTGTSEVFGNRGSGIDAGSLSSREPVTIRDSVLSGNFDNGIRVAGPRPLTVTGSRIGTDVSGRHPLRNIDNGVVAASASVVLTGNVVSANDMFGLLLTADADSVLIAGNRFGTDITGTKPLGNYLGGARIQQRGPNYVVRENTFAASRNGPGIHLLEAGGEPANAMRVRGNWVGTDPSGRLDLGNAGDGILVEGSHTIDIAGNVIAYNAGAGVVVGTSPDDASPVPSTDVRATDNVVFDNGSLAIDLEAFGERDPPTVNDPGDVDDGPNHLQNHPTVNTAASGPSGTRVTGTLHSAPGADYVIHVYAAPACGPFGRGESILSLGSTVVTTGAGGTARFRTTSPVRAPPGWVASATATAGFNTSEHSPCQPVGSPG